MYISQSTHTHTDINIISLSHYNYINLIISMTNIVIMTNITTLIYYMITNASKTFNCDNY